MFRVEPVTGWRAFIVWAVCGLLWTFSVISFAGPIVWPLAIWLTWLTARKTPAPRDRFGLLAGVGAMALIIGLIHVADNLCPESGFSTTADGPTSCGGLDSRPWFLVGGGILALALVLYRRRRVAQSEML